MDLPLPLRQAVDRALEGVAMSDLTAASAALSDRYRREVRDGRLHLSDARLALAYIATRLPATYAAIHASLTNAAARKPGFAPQTLLDIGAGPGTAMWAARDVWPTLHAATLLEASPAIRQIGASLAADSGITSHWREQDLRRSSADLPSADLVTLAYVLDELELAERSTLVDRIWRLTAGALVIVEPGTTAGWRRILDARAQLLSAGAHILAPCPHAQACPVAEPDWCHFSIRLARSRVHRLAKRAEVPWEDEKFVYLAASRTPATSRVARVLAPPEAATGRVRLKLCQTDGTLMYRLVTRREGDVFKQARRRDWGDVFEG